MSTSESKKITLKSSDEETFEVEEEVAVQSQTIKHVIEDNCADNTIPLPNVTGKLLAMVIEYCKKHVVGASKPDYNNSTSIDEEFKKWDANFLKDLKNDQETLFALIHAVDYLDSEENQWAFD